MEKNKRQNNLKKSSGITLIALVITIIVLLILAGVSLSMVFSQDGIFSKAEKATTKYSEAKARETLETVLMGDAQYEKHSNPKYNQDDFLNNLIKSEIEGANVEGDVAILGGYAFELDRSVPKIGRYLGDPKDLVFPTVEITSGPTLINNGRKSTFQAKATETTKGIKRIELWLNGKRIENQTKIYETAQTEVTATFEVNKNGKYTVKAYADIMGSEEAEVTGVVPTISFTPNGSEEWKKQHTTKVIIEDNGEEITSLKYIWIKDDGVNEPAETAFTEECPSNRIITGGNETMTGTYYLWVLLTMGTGESRKINIGGSEGFNFDNTAPTAEVKTEWTGDEGKEKLKISVTAQDINSGIDNQSIKLYIKSANNEKIQKPISFENGSGSTIIEGLKQEDKTILTFIVSDRVGNVLETDGATGRIYIVKNGKLVNGTISCSGGSSNITQGEDTCAFYIGGSCDWTCYSGVIVDWQGKKGKASTHWTSTSWGGSLQPNTHFLVNDTILPPALHGNTFESAMARQQLCANDQDPVSPR